MSETEATGPETPAVEAHGARIPALGLGTWELTGATAEEMTREALEAGYRHLDTAQAYGNEAEVGRGLRDAGVDRDDVFLTTKIWPDSYPPDRFREAVDERLRLLGVERVDLLLLHWPKFDGTTLERTVGLLNEARAAGKARHVGVSNFTVDLLERARQASEAPLVTNQVEYHPFLSQEAVLEAVRAHGACLTAYSPLAHGEVVDDATLEDVGAAHGVGAAVVAIRWLIQQPGVAAIPRSSDPDHVRENLGALEIELSDAEMGRVSALARPDGRVIDPSGLAPDWD